jgi:hypothetical protein
MTRDAIKTGLAETKTRPVETNTNTKTMVVETAMQGHAIPIHGLATKYKANLNISLMFNPNQQ